MRSRTIWNCDYFLKCILFLDQLNRKQIFDIFTDIGNKMHRHTDIKRTLNFDAEYLDLNLCFAQKKQPDFGIDCEH